MYRNRYENKFVGIYIVKSFHVVNDIQDNVDISKNIIYVNSISVNSNTQRICHKLNLKNLKMIIWNKTCRNWEAFEWKGKLLPTKIVLRPRIPAQWQESENFWKQVWEKVNKRVPKGKFRKIKIVKTG